MDGSAIFFAPMEGLLELLDIEDAGECEEISVF